MHEFEVQNILGEQDWGAPRQGVLGSSVLSTVTKFRDWVTRFENAQETEVSWGTRFRVLHIQSTGFKVNVIG